jgi:hypothetical protein
MCDVPVISRARCRTTSMRDVRADIGWLADQARDEMLAPVVNDVVSMSVQRCRRYGLFD